MRVSCQSFRLLDSNLGVCGPFRNYVDRAPLMLDLVHQNQKGGDCWTCWKLPSEIIETGKTFGWGEMQKITHKRKNGSFVNDEAMEIDEGGNILEDMDALLHTCMRPWVFVVERVEGQGSIEKKSEWPNKLMMVKEVGTLNTKAETGKSR
ncbi:hypothetical protein Fmac_011633 [Flemingia macrophylla]|uniref:Uncharacterized protein n=1 Tax=Flemingia macrophylla TaxID=520843 RepID=A0ABD1MNV2_9FABA